ncbi:hypothetical protein [Sphingobacterium chuzhouense]|uniref:Uncharacterized protein n=1 Tax=Sphingobacterium chuzhouense TaxID=1742264 RepID=A0ABR7XMM6_9SPHI|nr:hypothetical protein [Sphingobacterium chuzhouense]MBD1420378.1 hypothetical protein [Sphingobacterium chuzhouense]
METTQSKLPRKSIWIWDEDYPYSLTQEELKNPSLALEDIFKHYSLTDCQYLLWEWKHCHYRPYLFSFGNGLHTLYHFKCRLQKLLNVAWLIDEEFSCSQLLIPCNDTSFQTFRNTIYCIFLGETRNSLKTTITQLFNEEDGLQGFMNVLRHWWDLGIDWRHLDVGDRCQVGNEIPEFRRLMLMIELMYFIYKSNYMREETNLYAASAYLSLEEAKHPAKTLMKIFSKWEYEDLKKLLRDLFYTMHTHCGLEEGIMGSRCGIIHTYHKLIGLAHTLSLQDNRYFEEEKHFTMNYSDVGDFSTEYNFYPLHYLLETDVANLINNLRGYDYHLLHRKLHEYALLLSGKDGSFEEEDGRRAVLLFQELEKLMETLYLLMLDRIQIDW